MSALGEISIFGALALALYAIGASLVGVRRRAPEIVASGRNAAIGVTILYTTASAALILGLLTHDFSMQYVFDHSSRTMPPDLSTAAFYSGQEGSLLYWGWTLSLFSAFVLWQQRKPGPHQVFMPYVIAVIMTVDGFMALLLGLVTSPFTQLPFTPPDGVGLNPLLYDPGMRIHPPMLLAGLMAWTVPFAFSVAAMATGQLGNEWVKLARRYAMVAWLILGLGNLLGAWWAYHVLGWGGYWGWDPVENVALMPWLVGTAFIHSIQIQERRGMLKAWNLVLIMVAFFLSIFGTFVVRSGILASVHSFALSAIGPYFLTFLGAVMAGTLALFFWRLPRLRSENELDSFLSRESSFLMNNLLFVGVTFAIFWGTIYPLVAEAVAGAKITVGAPYFSEVAGPLLGVLLLLMGIGPLMPWRRATPQYLLRNFLPPIVATIICLGILVALGVRDTYAVLGFAVCLWVVATIAQEFVRGTWARHHATGEGYLTAMVTLVRRNNRRYGGYLVHLGIVMIGVGVIGSHVYQLQNQVTLTPGQSATIGSYTLTLQGLQTYAVPGSTIVEASLIAGSDIVRPQKVYFPNFEDQPSTKVGLLSTPLQDLYVVLSGFNTSGSTPQVSLSLFVNPLVSWIWAGGPMLLLGTLVAFWPAPEPVARKVLAPAPKGAVGALA